MQLRSEQQILWLEEELEALKRFSNSLNKAFGIEFKQLTTLLTSTKYTYTDSILIASFYLVSVDLQEKYIVP